VIPHVGACFGESPSFLCRRLPCRLGCLLCPARFDPAKRPHAFCSSASPCTKPHRGGESAAPAQQAWRRSCGASPNHHGNSASPAAASWCPAGGNTRSAVPGPSSHLLAHLEVVVGGGRNQGAVWDAEHLALLGQASATAPRNRAAHPAADVRRPIFIERGRGGRGESPPQAGGERPAQKRSISPPGGQPPAAGQGLAGVGPRNRNWTRFGAVILLVRRPQPAHAEKRTLARPSGLSE